MQRRPITTENAIARLEALCARAEHCSFELSTKLRGWGITGASAEEIINHLIDNRFVDDLRFAQSFVRDRYRFSGHGRRKIILALIAKHIPRNIINTALEEIDDEVYFNNLCHIINRKASSLDMTIYDNRNKIYRYAIGRGYESNLIVKALKLYISNNKE